MPNNLVVCLLS